MDEIILKNSNVRPECMTDTEIAILNQYTPEMVHFLDPIDLVEYLYKIKFVDREFCDKIYDKLFNRRWSKAKLCEYLISELSSFCCLFSLINILGELGYHYIARKLLEMIVLPKSESIVRVSRVDTSNRRQVQYFFKTLKRKVWNAEFKNPLENLRSLAERLQFSMLAETDVHKRQVLADKVVAVLGAEIDAHAITFDTELSEHDLFRDLREIVPQTTNTMVTDVILYGRRANACAIGKNFDSSEKYLQKAKSVSAFMTPCLELANMIYCEVYVKLWQFEENPIDEIRESLVQMAEVGIECLRDEEDEIRLLWTRMFLLRMTFCLLGIGNRASIIKICHITPKHLAKARNVLEILDKTLDDMDTRREMFYRMGFARLLELEGRIDGSYTFIKKSLKLAIEGNFKEENFIRHYKGEIEDMLNAQNPRTAGVVGDEITSNVLNVKSFENSTADSLSIEEESYFGIEFNRPSIQLPIFVSSRQFISLSSFLSKRSSFLSVALKSVSKEYDLDIESLEGMSKQEKPNMSLTSTQRTDENTRKENISSGLESSFVGGSMEFPFVGNDRESPFEGGVTPSPLPRGGTKSPLVGGGMESSSVGGSMEFPFVGNDRESPFTFEIVNLESAADFNTGSFQFLTNNKESD